MEQYFQVQYVEPDGRGVERAAQAGRVVGSGRVATLVQGRANLQGSRHLRLHSEEEVSAVHPALSVECASYALRKKEHMYKDNRSLPIQIPLMIYGCNEEKLAAVGKNPYPSQMSQCLYKYALVHGPFSFIKELAFNSLGFI